MVVLEDVMDRKKKKKKTVEFSNFDTRTPRGIVVNVVRVDA